MDAAEIAKMKVADLKKELKSRSLSTVGNKNELADRLTEALQNESDIGLDGDNDELIDEDDVLADESEILAEHEGSTAEDELLESATPTTKEAPKAVTITTTPTTETTTSTTMKKIILNRDTNPRVPDVAEPEKSTAAVPAPASNESESENEPKVVKLDGLSAKERLELRAKKFGATAPPDSELKKQARAERFGITDPKSEATAPKGVDLEKLKQRQARFGVVESTVLKKAEMDEQKQKRAERFGVQAGGGASNGTNSDGSSEAKKKRAERFGLQAA